MDATGKLAIITTFHPDKKIKGAERLHWLDKTIRGILEPYSYIPTLVAIEGYAFGSFSGRERLGEWGGVLRLMLFRIGLPFVEIPPSTLKKYVTGKGNSKKNQMLLSVFKKWGITCEDDNQSDAYGLAQLIRTGQSINTVRSAK